VLLSEPDGSLSVHAARGVADEARAEFSRSIAEGVIATREPVVTLDAQGDARLKSLHPCISCARVVACVPIWRPPVTRSAHFTSRRAAAWSALERELPTLRAFADKSRSRSKTRAWCAKTADAPTSGAANEDLADAQERLRELLDGRTSTQAHAPKLRDARETLYSHFGYRAWSATSNAMRKVYALVDRVKDTDVPVLITGESGPAKKSWRARFTTLRARQAKMLGVNCGAIPKICGERAVRSRARSFTGAERDRKGLFREAEGGSLLLDEIGEMPVKMQAVCCGCCKKSVCVRSAARTKSRWTCGLVRDQSRPRTHGARGKIREDCTIAFTSSRSPAALRERGDDVPQLVDYFLACSRRATAREKDRFARRAARLQAYGWPGNVRSSSTCC